MLCGKGSKLFADRNRREGNNDDTRIQSDL